MNKTNTPPSQERLISFYKDSYQVEKSTTELTIRQFLDFVVLGEWRKHVEKVRSLKSGSEEYSKAKKNGPSVTIGGTFNKRNDEGVKEFSGLLAADIDKLEDAFLLELQNKLRIDPYVFAVFRSIGGSGLCVIFKVDSNRYAESFDGIESYFAEKYGVVVGFDKSVKNVSRLRYVSYDKDAYVNEGCTIFKQYPKRQPKRKPETFIHTENDIDFVISQIEERGIEFHDTGGDYVRAGLAIASKYDSAGEDYFQRICQFRKDYNPDKVAKDYAYFCRNKKGQVTIATFYFLCKQMGLRIVTAKTKEIATLASFSKKNTNTLQGAIDKITSMTDTSVEDATEICTQVYASEAELDITDNIFEEMEMFLRANYPMKRNLITRFIEGPNSKVYEETDFNTIYVAAQKSISDKVKYNDLERLIRSDFTVSFNPFLDFFRDNKNRPKTTGLIRKLSETIHAATMLNGKAVTKEYIYHFLRKWLIGIVYSMHGIHSPLALVFTGGMNIGKTEWFRRLLPVVLQMYFGESELDKGQDDEILMCKKLLLLNDEFGGMTNKDAKRFKNLTSKQTFSLREPYGRTHVDLQRIAVLCGSCNENDILNDPTGNRRIIPLHLINIDQKSYNEIDKVDLFMEVYDEYLKGENHHLKQDEIDLLNENSAEFQDLSLERELIDKYYSVPIAGQIAGIHFLSTTEMKVFLEKVSGQKLGLKKIAQELNRMKFVQKILIVRGKTKRGFSVFSDTEHTDTIASNDVPF